jgi:rhomboid protease GluP
MIRVRIGDTESVITLDAFERAAARGEIPPDAWVCTPTLTGNEFVPAHELPIFPRHVDGTADLFRAHFRLSGFPWMTLVFLLVYLGVYALTLRLGNGVASKEALITLGAKVPARIIDDGETWRLLTANFLHHDLRHLLFNAVAWCCVGAALEGSYRRSDVVFLWITTGVMAMTASTLANPPATVGASGMIFGSLGCAVVFGIRFADILPRLYQHVFGIVMVGYTMAMFGIGLLSNTTDNWGHAGGLLTGALFGALLQPRLLLARPRSQPRGSTGLIFSLVLVGVVVAAGWVVPSLSHGWRAERFSSHGVVLQRPRSWNSQANPLQPVAYGNASDALVSLACGQRQATKPALADAAQRFVDGELAALMHGGSIAQLQVEHAVPAMLGGTQVRTLVVPFSFLGSDGRFRARATIFVFADVECVLATAAREGASAVSLQRLQEVEQRVSLEEPQALLLARRHAELHPADWSAHWQWVEALCAWGDVMQARRELERAFDHANEDGRITVLARWLSLENREQAAGDPAFVADVAARAAQATPQDGGPR